ncbi:hypothetical protein C9374_007927 [Naegleria lovaniensis]|uniref:Calcineurin-like phosphoesterase domain-containing protein n=1 Tax=Naegleria lovaniensis TaxID=51637 RepID=A0AA88KLD5_NAELO|nr:uncharacterized protein C9374_007927 [Naegleria lovaniensis]KAG2378779.1 hypothetical protein C9374_007927 [Naegleria lovaniensis]
MSSSSMAIEDIFRSNNFTVYLLSIVFSSFILVVFTVLYFIVLTIRCCLQHKVEKKIRLEQQARDKEELQKQQQQQQHGKHASKRKTLHLSTTAASSPQVSTNAIHQERSSAIINIADDHQIEISRNSLAHSNQHGESGLMVQGVSMNGIESITGTSNSMVGGVGVGGVTTLLQFDPFAYEDESEEWTCGAWNKSLKCWIGMEVLYFVENVLLLFMAYALITYISSLVAFQYLHWGAGIAINLFLTILTVLHGVRYRLIHDKLNSMVDLEEEASNVTSPNNDYRESMAEHHETIPTITLNHELSSNHKEIQNNTSLDPSAPSPPTSIDSHPAAAAAVHTIIGDSQQQSSQMQLSTHTYDQNSVVASSPVPSTPSNAATTHGYDQQIELMPMNTNGTTTSVVTSSLQTLPTSSSENINSGNTNNIEMNVTVHMDELTSVKRQQTKLVILRQEDVNENVDIHKFKLLDGPPKVYQDDHLSTTAPSFHKKERSLHKRLASPFEIYFKSIQYGIVNRFILFILYLILAMVITIVLTSFFYGTCICLNDFEFSTTFTRYVNSRESLSVCGERTICSQVLMLPEKPQREMIVKFFTESRPQGVSFVIYSKNSTQLNAFIQQSSVSQLLDGSALYSNLTVLNSLLSEANRNQTNVDMLLQLQTCSVEDLNEFQAELIQRYVHTCKLSALTPQTSYYFSTFYFTIVERLSSEFTNNVTSNYKTLLVKSSTLSKWTTFSNMMANPIKFIVSGEVGFNDKSLNMMKEAIQNSNPSFIAFTGNIAFDNGFLTCYGRWVKFLSRYQSIALDSNNNSIPLLTAIGNHETLFWRFKANSENDLRPYRAFILHEINKTGASQEFSHMHYIFNENSTTCSMMVLDSHVVKSHESQQSFIVSKYSSGVDKYRMVMYNMPLYPSVSDFDTELSRNGRNYWSPLFTTHNVTLAFEGYDRSYKRTKVIAATAATNNGVNVSPNVLVQNQTSCSFSLGTTHVGDGSMGADLARSLSSVTTSVADLFYTRQIAHNYKEVTCDGVNGVKVKVFNDNGALLDYFERY